MDADGLPLIGPGVDLSKVEPIPPKRILAFLNHFITHTVGFLNRFSCVCEEKLENMTIRMQRLEISMNILEAKLSSIPGLDSVVVVAAPQQQQAVIPVQSNGLDGPEVHDVARTPEDQPSTGNTGNTNSNLSSQGENVVTNKDNPVYKKYFTMLNMGIPAAAVKQKMIMENVNPNILDNPSGGSTVSAPTSVRQERKSDSDFGDTDEQSNSSEDDNSSASFDD